MMNCHRTVWLLPPELIHRPLPVAETFDHTPLPVGRHEENKTTVLDHLVAPRHRRRPHRTLGQRTWWMAKILCAVAIDPGDVWTWTKLLSLQRASFWRILISSFSGHIDGARLYLLNEASGKGGFLGKVVHFTVLRNVVGDIKHLSSSRSNSEKAVNFLIDPLLFT